MDEVILAAPPGDGVSQMVFSPSQTELLLVASWDATMRLYDVNQNIPRSTFDFNGAACLTCCFDIDGAVAFAGGLDGNARLLDINRGAVRVIGSHTNAISCMEFSGISNTL